MIGLKIDKNRVISFEQGKEFIHLANCCAALYAFINTNFEIQNL